MNWCLAAIVNHHYASPPSLSWLVTVNQCLLVLTNSIWFMAKRKAGRVLGVGCRTSFERTLVGVKSQLQLRQLWNAINPSGFNPFSRKAASALAGFWYFANLPNFGAKAWFAGVQYTQYKVRFGKHKLLSLSIQSHYEIQSHYVIALNGPSVSQSPIAILYYMWMECWSWRWYFLQSNNIWSLLGCKSGQNWPSFVSCQLKHVAHKFRVLFLL